MHIEHVKLGEDGRLVIPAVIRHSIGLKPGDTLVIESDGDSLLIRGLDQVVREVQSAFAHYQNSHLASGESAEMSSLTVSCPV